MQKIAGEHSKVPVAAKDRKQSLKAGELPNQKIVK
jgi:hypothetical protein